MEPFNFLKYWKPAPNATQNDNTLIHSDNGPFFDLELALTDEDDSQDDTVQTQNDDDQDDDNSSDSDKDFNFTLSPSSSNHPTISLSPSHHVIFKGNLLLNSPPNSKPHFTSSFFKSATKFRVFMLGLKKPKPNAPNEPPTHPKNQRQRKLFTVNFKVEEVPIVSLFTRDNSSRAKPSHNQSAEETESTQTEPHTHAEMLSSPAEEKRLMRKYLKMVKPLYVRVSKRYADKMKFSDQVDVSSPESAKAAAPCSTVAEKVPPEAEGSETEGTANVKGQKQGNVPLPAGLRKHLGKGRSTAPPPPPMESSKRRDDSLLQQHDWIQGAILHCKRSFNASSTECECPELPRSASDPLHDISPELSEKPTSANVIEVVLVKNEVWVVPYSDRNNGLCWREDVCLGKLASGEKGKCGQRSGKDGDMSSESIGMGEALSFWFWE
ncbi:unnamed protein product [Sphenostylis stenocarpa]|uniref:Membrane-associated kinase regulator 2 n=1 Tax=Sphenostylis stenocarpa TaxID=92480 RepID=A0AA86SER5_9FABA|nr:unnamed protein product [Sphenostylis stenocarpa]